MTEHLKDINLLTTDRILSEKVLDQFLMRIYRNIGNYISYRIKNTFIRANHLTWLSFILSIISSYFFLFQSHYVGFIIGSIFFLFNVIFDFADGSLARIKGEVSYYGWYLDQALDDIKNLLFVLSLSIGLYKLTNDYRIWICGILIFASDYFGDLAMSRFKTVFFKETGIDIAKFQSLVNKKNLFYLFGKNITPVWLWRATLLVVFSLLDQIFLFFIIFTIWGTIVSLILIFYVGIKIKNQLP